MTPLDKDGRAKSVDWTTYALKMSAGEQNMAALDKFGREIRIDWLHPRLPRKREGRPNTRARRLADGGTQAVLNLEGYALSQHSHDREAQRFTRLQERLARKLGKPISEAEK